MENPTAFARTLVPFVALALAACATPEVVDPTVVRADSAGIRVVTSAAEDRELPWRFERVGEMRDSAGEPWLFVRVPASHVVTDRGSRTYVLTSDPAIIRFGPGGAFERSIGRKGSAPGEMQFPRALGAQGDSLFVQDPDKGTLVRWGPDLAPISDIRLEGAFAELDAIAFRTGGFWAHKRSYDGKLYSLTLIGDTLGSPPLHRVVPAAPATVRMCGGMIRIPPMFSPQILWSASGPRIVVNAEPQYVVWMYEGARLIASVRRPMATRAPTTADAEREMPDGFRVRFGSGPLCTLSASDAMAQMGVSAMLPLIAGVKLLSDGTIWVARRPSDDRGSMVDVFSADGAYAGTVRAMELPVGSLPNGDLLVPVEDTLSGGYHLVRMKVTR
jgi:hypothetical protein